MAKPLRATITAVSLAGLMLPAHAGNEWEPVRQGQGREDIGTWVRSVDGMAVKAFKGVTEVHQTTLTVLALLADIPGLSHWVYQCQSSIQPDQYSADHTYARFKGIWPASDRDVLFRSTVTQQADGSVLVDSLQVEGYPPQDGFVRMPYLHNTFRLVPLKGQWTRVEFETQVDLGGLVPTWLANAVSTKAPLVTLEGLKAQVGQARYQIKSVQDLPAYYHKGKLIDLPAWHLQP
ncbi:hypothetical protein JY96_06275 [Aquabacterium sp. NJ1]|uniref:START domain-containing protein n=1 Tax=Aquabacterium sp. NJ1 TaxID=1538295 RepID=UPI00052D8BC1|nr:START domain-containing protein [Aquabacterium sp. NJ1]KGM39767.1 hypothetical protein JY96_06275 [Aquabacterium sp. NJ1]